MRIGGELTCLIDVKPLDGQLTHFSLGERGGGGGGRLICDFRFVCIFFRNFIGHSVLFGETFHRSKDRTDTSV